MASMRIEIAGAEGYLPEQRWNTALADLAILCREYIIEILRRLLKGAPSIETYKTFFKI